MQTYAMHISYATAYSNALFLIQFQSEINQALGIIFATLGLISEPAGMIRSNNFVEINGRPLTPNRPMHCIELYFLVYLQ